MIFNHLAAAAPGNPYAPGTYGYSQYNYAYEKGYGGIGMGAGGPSSPVLILAPRAAASAAAPSAAPVASPSATSPSAISSGAPFSFSGGGSEGGFDPSQLLQTQGQLVTTKAKAATPPSNSWLLLLVAGAAALLGAG